MIKYKANKVPNWAEVAEKTATNSHLCEVCGHECGDIVTRKVRQRYAEKRRTNRVRINPDYFKPEYSWAKNLLAAGMKDWAGKMACPDCYKKFEEVLCKR